MVSAPNRFSASSKETLVLVEFSKNKLAMVMSRKAGVFFTGPLSNSLKLSAVSKIVWIWDALNPLIPSRCLMGVFDVIPYCLKATLEDDPMTNPLLHVLRYF